MKEFNKKTKLLLSKESALSSMNLGVGLTFLRKYDFTSLGFIYQAFFSLSTGLERILKLILVYEYIYLNDSIPSKEYLKSKGHNIKTLFNEIKPYITKYSSEKYFDIINGEPICNKIIENLSDFAVQNRYFNLNELSGISNTKDPVKRWDKEVNSLIIEKHYRPNTKKKNAIRAMSNTMSEFTLIRHHAEDEREIQDYNSFTEESLMIETKQKYGMYYMFCIIKALCELQRNQNYDLYSDIHLHEFFMVFRADYNYAKRIKTWNPHPPYRF